MTDQDDLRGQILSGLESGAFSAYYQPKFDSDSEDIIGVEALLRWHHPDGGLTEAAAFMDAVERLPELTRRIDAWVLATTTQQGRRWWDEGLSFQYLNVNISAWTADAQLADMVKAALKDSGFPAKSLALECPWRMLTENPEAVAGVMRDVRALGCTVVVDDAPLDADGLAVVRGMPVQYAKVPVWYLQDALKTHGRGALSGRVKTWRKAGIGIIAKGVESEDQAALSHKAGCRYSQGNRFKSALPADEVTFLLRLLQRTKEALRLL